MKATITNTSKANQGVYTDEGLVFIEPGKSRELTIAADYVERVKALPFFKIKGDGSDDGLDQLKGPALKALAAAEGVDLMGATKNADVIAAIRAARAAPAADTDPRTDDELRAALVEFGEVDVAELDRAAMLELLA